MATRKGTQVLSGDIDNKYITVAETTRTFNRSRFQIYQWIRAGRITAQKMGTLVLLNRQEVEVMCQDVPPEEGEVPLSLWETTEDEAESLPPASYIPYVHLLNAIFGEGIFVEFLPRLPEILASVLDNGIDERERRALALRYGLDGHQPHTLRYTGFVMGVTAERVRQITHKALRKLRHPKQSHLIRSLVWGYANRSIARQLGIMEVTISAMEDHLDTLSKASHTMIITESGRVKRVPPGMLIDALGLSTRPYNVLHRYDIFRIDELSSLSEESVSRMRNMGHSSVAEIKAALEACGETFAPAGGRQ